MGKELADLFQELEDVDEEAGDDILMDDLDESEYSDQTLDFDAFCLWSLASTYTEVFLGLDQKERQLRIIARDYGIDIHEVEKVKKIFDRFDTDGSEDINQTEFGSVICALMRAQDLTDIADAKLKRLWREVDLDGS